MRPIPASTPGWEADNDLGLGIDGAPGAQGEGCCSNSKQNPVFAGGYTLEHASHDCYYSMSVHVPRFPPDVIASYTGCHGFGGFPSLSSIAPHLLEAVSEL